MTNGSDSTVEWSMAVINFQNRQSGFNSLGNTLEDNTTDPSHIASWNSDTTYDLPGNAVKYINNSQCGVFVNAWWTHGNEPSFVPSSSNPWKIEELMEADCSTVIVNNVTDWDENGEYNGGSFVMYESQCYKPRYWTKGDVPVPNPEHFWDTPWETSSCDIPELVPIIDPVGGGKSGIEQLPPQTSTAEANLPDGTPLVPPVILAPETASLGSIIAEPTESITTKTDTELPSEGYEFLRQVTAENWEWLFPLRSGKYNAQGSNRNLEPFANPDGSTDIFTLANFINAVQLYNNWANANDYKQFLNEGSLKQQAQEFLVFWAKSARETSGTWSGAPSPWIDSYSNTQGETTDVWKGAVYWTEETGYTTASDGTSPTINYIDPESEYTPVANRSYHGRGIIQLSWNYNYGAFSAWLYDNNVMPELIEARDILLSRPDYVAIHADLAMLSGIWFWMTPQGTKPSCHDVLYGDVYNVSSTTQEQGLPPRNDALPIYAAAGDTNNEAVMAYRVGTVINIVNGGIECNKATTWHPGPMQRISYFNAYAMYFNDQISELEATRVTAATNVWDQHVSASSDDNLKTASCYAQKSYYSW